MRKLYFLNIIFWGNLSFAETSLTLQEALKLALEGNHEIQAAQIHTESAKDQLSSARGKYLPSVNLEAKYTHLNDDINIDLGDIRKAMIGSAGAATGFAGGNSQTTINYLNSTLPEFSTQVQKQDFYNASVTLTQPLFTGGKISANHSAQKSLFNSAQTEQENTQGKILAQTVQNYRLAQLAEYSKQVRSEALAGMKLHQRNAANLLRAGQLSKAAKMKVDVSVLEAERELAKATRESELAMKVLASTLNKPDESFKLTSGISMPQAGVKDEYLQIARQNSPALKQIQYKNELLNAKHKVKKSEFMPTLAVFGKYELYKDDLTTLEPEWAVGVGFKMNIFNGGSDKKELSSIRKDKIMLEHLNKNAQEMLQIGIEKVYSDLKNSEEQYQSLIKSEELAKESLRLNSEAFANGMAKNTDVIDAELTLASVKLAMNKALYDYNNNLAQLLVISGQHNQFFKTYTE